MTDDVPDGVTEVQDYPVRERVGGLLAVGGFALLSLFFYEGRFGDVSLAAQFGFADRLVEGVLLGLAAIVAGVGTAVSGYVTD